MKRVINIGLAVIIMGILANLLFGGSADSEADIPALIKAGALVVDVRTAREFSGGHIEGAVNIPYNRIDREIGDQGKDKPIIVYCHSGARSASAKRTLMQAGYTNVINGGSLHRMQKQLSQ
jgi:rhodanese-related sulfurtransferase